MIKIELEVALNYDILLLKYYNISIRNNGAMTIYKLILLYVIFMYIYNNQYLIQSQPKLVNMNHEIIIIITYGMERPKRNLLYFYLFLIILGIDIL